MEKIIPKILDRNILKLVNIKIDQLETASERNLSANNSKENDSRKKTKKIIPDILIPFLVMFICLNYDSIVSPDDKLKR